MSENYQKQLISDLLDKYERSSFFREGKQPTRRIMLKLYDGGKTDFPKYDIEQAEKRTLINLAVFSLSEIKIVSYQWMKGEEDHIIAKVWLDYENITSAYDFIGRKPKGDEIDAICLELLDALDIVHSEWAKHFFNDAYEAISQKRSIGNRLPSEESERSDLIRAIRFIDQMGDIEILERVFSLQCFGDSKRFEKVIRPRLVSVLSRYLDSADDSTDEVLLRQIGITKNPEQFDFCGSVSIVFDSGAVDFSHLRYGGSINTDDLQRGHLGISPQIDRVLSIENRANYIEYIYKQRSENELVVFHGGQFGPAKRKFLQAIATAMSAGSEWYHWGDIDYGGFSMLARLRREIKRDVLPYRMDKKELEQYSLLTAAVQPQYIEKLCSLRQRDELGDCLSCIEYMIENRVKLEQEAMLTDFLF
jgi:hypothetical protein